MNTNYIYFYLSLSWKIISAVARNELAMRHAFKNLYLIYKQIKILKNVNIKLLTSLFSCTPEYTIMFYDMHEFVT